MIDKNKKNGVVMISAFPPPMGGAAKNSKKIAESIESAGVPVDTLNTSVGIVSHGRSIIYHINRLKLFFLNFFKLFIFLVSGRRKVYIVPDGGLGIFYTFGYVLLSSLFSVRFWFHYRNFSYIEKKSFVLKLILFFSRNKCTHIFLDEYMKERFCFEYNLKEDSDFLIVYNAGSVDFSISNSDLYQGEDIIVGYLSNLCNEKGFCDIVNLIKNYNFSCGRKVFFHIAGKPVSKSDECLLEEIKKNPMVRYFGQIEGEKKKKFYIDCDIFIFPTRFSQEAQPNVLWEALSAGVFPIAYEKGSIAWMLGAFYGKISDENTLMPCLVNEIKRISEGKGLDLKVEIKKNIDLVLKESALSFLNLINNIVESDV